MYLCFRSSTDGLVVGRLACLDKRLSSNPVELMFCSGLTIFFFPLFILAIFYSFYTSMCKIRLQV